MAVCVFVVEAQYTEHKEEAGRVGQGIQAASGNGGQAVEDLQIAAGAEEGIGQRLVHEPQAAGGGAGNAGEDAGGEDAPDIGVHIQAQHPVHNALESVGILDYSTEGQHRGQTADAGDAAPQTVDEQTLPVLALQSPEVEHIGEDGAQQHGAGGQHGGVGDKLSAYNDDQQQHHDGQEAFQAGGSRLRSLISKRAGSTLSG